MKRLKIPLRDVDVRTIYQECADSFGDKTALGYIEEVVSSSDVYETFVPKDISHLPEQKINKGDEEKIIKVYTDKFAKQDMVGYKYYKAIKSNAKGCCPICGGGKLSTLDHFLPKSVYPLFCVTPVNLIPMCRECNSDKRKLCNTDYYKIPFNPYFDDMDDEWLECEIDFKSEDTFEIVYINGYDKDSNEQLWEKYKTHLEIFKLNDTFTAKADEEINNSKYGHQELLRRCGPEIFETALKEYKQGCEKYDINSWKSALYRELVRKIQDYCEWLTSSDKPEENDMKE